MCRPRHTIFDLAYQSYVSTKVSDKIKYTLCSKKSDAKIQITITTSHLIRINYPFRSFNNRLSGTNVANFNKIHHMVSEQQLFKKWDFKTEFFPIWKIPISILTAGSVTNNDVMLVTFCGTFGLRKKQWFLLKRVEYCSKF